MFAPINQSIMKINILLIACVGLISLSSCKKDRECECTTTYTNEKGETETDQPETITYIDIKKSEAKSLCQKTTTTHVKESGKTVTQVDDCKLK
jgi:hypothetical protein